MSKAVFLTITFILILNNVNAQLELVAESTRVWNGVTTSIDGRVFVNFPKLEGGTGMSIGEVLTDGNIIPYPNEQWNNWRPGDDVSRKFIRTNSLRIGPDGILWVVDTGTPSIREKPLSGKAQKLVAIDVEANEVVQIIPLAHLTKPSSFIDDLRILGNTIYLTDAGEPALILLDKTNGKGKRVLQNHISTTAIKPIKAEGKVVRDENGDYLRINADQLEISPDGKWLYFQAASGPMWKVETRYLNDNQMTKKELEKEVEIFYQTSSTGGTAIDAQGNIYLSDVNKNRILKISSERKKSLLIKDKRLLWADALWIDDNGFLWIPTGQLNRLAVFQNGKSKVDYPVQIYKLNINAEPLKN